MYLERAFSPARAVPLILRLVVAAWIGVDGLLRGQLVVHGSSPSRFRSVAVPAST